MIIAIVDGGQLQVFNSVTGKIVSGAVGHWEPAQPDSRLDIAIGLLEDLNERVMLMSQTQDTVASEVATLKGNMVSLHSVLSAIQARLDAAVQPPADGGSTDPSVLDDLRSVNADFKATLDGLAGIAGVPASPAASSSTASASLTESAAATDTLSASVSGAAAAPAAEDPANTPQPVVFDATNTAPNVPGGRNSSQLPNFDPSKPETP